MIPLGEVRKWLWLAAAVLAIGAALWWASRSGYPGEHGSRAPTPDSLLNIPLERTVAARQEFLQAYRAGGRQRARELYEEFLPRIGANGIRQVVESQFPFCHTEGHDLGKLIFSKLRDVGASLESCADACTSGCMHGVLMEFFTDSSSMAGSEHHDHSAQLTAAEVASRIPTFCETAAVTRMYRAGDCAHGVGHAVMFLSNYDIPAGIELCDRFPSYALRYYCATGAYMESRNHPDARWDYPQRGPFYPCDRAVYPAACFRYVMLNTIRWHHPRGGTLDLQRQCATLTGKYRLGCFHGLGFAHLSQLLRGTKTLAEVCGFGTRDDQTVCLEGAMERLGRFTPVLAAERCESLTDWRRGVCQKAASRKMYDMEKSFAMYQR